MPPAGSQRAPWKRGQPLDVARLGNHAVGEEAPRRQSHDASAERTIELEETTREAAISKGARFVEKIDLMREVCPH